MELRRTPALGRQLIESSDDDPRISNYQTPWCAFYKLDFERHPTSGQAEKLFATISAPDPLKCFFPMFYFFSPINVSDKWPNICHDSTEKNINIEWVINGSSIFSLLEFNIY